MPETRLLAECGATVPERDSDTHLYRGGTSRRAGTGLPSAQTVCAIVPLDYGLGPDSLKGNKSDYPEV